MSTHAKNKKFLCVRLWKGTCFCQRVLLSSSFFFLSSLTHNRALKIQIFVAKSDVLGEPRREERGEHEKMEKRRKKGGKKNDKKTKK